MAKTSYAFSTHAEVLANITSIRQLIEHAGCVDAGQIIEDDDLHTAKHNPSLNKAIQVLATCLMARNKAKSIAKQAKTLMEESKQQAELAEDNPHQEQIQHNVENKALALSKKMGMLTQQIADIDQHATQYTLQAIASMLQQQQTTWLPLLLKAAPTLSNDHKALLEELTESMDPRPVLHQLQERGIDLPDNPDYWNLMATLTQSLSKGVLS